MVHVLPWPHFWKDPGFFLQLPFFFIVCIHPHRAWPSMLTDAFCIRATYRQAPSESPPCLLGVFMKTPLHWTGEPPTTPPKLRSRDPNKPPAFRNSALAPFTGGTRTWPSPLYIITRVHDEDAKIWPVLHLQFIQTSSTKSNLPVSWSKAVH